MPIMPHIEPPYARPDAAMFPAPAIGAVGSLARAMRLGPLVGDPTSDEARAGGFRAALAAGVAARAAGAAAPAGQAVAPLPRVIATRDTLSLHPELPLENPFEVLLRHHA